MSGPDLTECPHCGMWSPDDSACDCAPTSKTKQAFEQLARSMGANIWRPLVDDGCDEALATLLDGAAEEIDAMKAWRRDFGELKEAVGDESGLVQNIAAGAVRRIAELEKKLAELNGVVVMSLAAAGAIDHLGVGLGFDNGAAPADVLAAVHGRLDELEAELARAKLPPPSACADPVRLARIRPETVRAWLEERGISDDWLGGLWVDLPDDVFAFLKNRHDLWPGQVLAELEAMEEAR